MAKRKRDIQLKVRVTPEERAMIEAKMAQLGTTNMGAYLRKMAIDGYVVKLDLPELRELLQHFHHRNGRCPAAGHIVMLLPPLREKGDVREQVDRGLED